MQKGNNDNKQSLISLSCALINLFIALILVASLLGLLALIVGIQNIEDVKEFMATFSDIMISSLKIAVVLLTFLLLAMFVRWLSKDEQGITVLPFEITIQDNTYRSEAISQFLVAELQRIIQIHDKDRHREDLSGFVPVESEKMDLPFFAPTRSITSENLSYNIVNIGDIGTGSISIPVGQLMLALKGIWPWGNTGQIITGSLQKYGSTISLTACLEHQNVCALEVHSRGKDKQIPNLVRELSFQIAHELSPGSTKNWLGLKYFTNSLEAYYNYNYEKNRGDLELARENCLKAANFDPKYEKLLGLIYNLGMIYSKIGEYDKAENLMNTAITIKKDYEFGLFGLGYIYGSQGNHSKALEYFERTIDIEKHDHAASWSNKGTALDKLSQYRAALSAFQKAIEIDQNYVYAWNGKGNALREMENPEKALEAFEKAIEIDHNYVHAWNGKGNALIDMENPEKALEAYEKAIEIDQN